MYADAEGSGERAALTFHACSESRGARLLEYRVSPAEQAQADETNLIFALEGIAGVSALGCLGGAPSGTSVVF